MSPNDFRSGSVTQTSEETRQGIKSAVVSLAGLIQKRWQLVPFIFLCAILINQLRVEWTVNPQYAYGWVVPVLCLGLVMRRLQSSTPTDLHVRKNETALFALRFPIVQIGWLWGIFLGLALLWLPTRMIQEANPEWRLISWLLSIEVIGLTLLGVRFAFGSERARQILIPVCLFFMAIPWPTVIEGPLIQGLTRLNVTGTVELLGWLGIPASQHANVIEISTGVVGIDEACSGIRSFQSSIMISLFFGEFYRFDLWRRLLMLSAGFILSFAFNACRTSLLTLIAAKKGVGAISQYHDPAGLTILLACTAALWGVAWLLSRSQLKAAGRTAASGVWRGGAQDARKASNSKTAPQPPGATGSTSGGRELESDAGTRRTGCETSDSQRQIMRRLCLALLLWLVLVECTVELWYRAHEWRVPKAPAWVVEWPKNNPTFVEAPMSEKALQYLRYDEATSASWREADGTTWQMVFLRWLPGRIAVHLAKMHTPEACLKAAGEAVEPVPGLSYLPVKGLRLPFRTYVINEETRRAHVFYCLWEDRATEHDQSFQTEKISYGNRLRPVLAGRRNTGQRALEIVVRGIDDTKEAQAAVVRQLEKLIHVAE